MMKLTPVQNVSLVRDAENLAGRYLETSYDTVSKLVRPRPGFICTSPMHDERAVNGGGFLLDGYLKRFRDPASGAKENVFYGRDIRRVLYDAENKPVGAVIFNKTQDGRHFDAVVLAPGAEDQIMRVNPDGSQSLYRSPGSFSDEFSMRSIGTISGHDKSGSPIYNFGK